MNVKLFLINIVLLVAFVVDAETKSTTILHVTDDVYVHADDGDKSKSKGDSTYVRCFYNDGSTAREMIFLKFDLKEIGKLLEGTDKVVTSAKLNLYGIISPGGGGSPATPTDHLLKVFNMTATNPAFQWTEKTLSYNAWLGNGSGTTNSGKSNAYYFRRNPDNTNVSTNNGNANYLVASLSAGAGQGWYQWDVTKAVREYTGRDLSLQLCDDYLMRLPNTTTDRAYATFHSKENASGNIPYLEIEFGEIPGDENYNMARGNETILRSYYNDSKNYRFMPFLKFDLANSPHSSEIESVKLKMYAVADAGGGVNTSTNLTTPTTHTLAVYNLNNYEKSWTESDFTYMDWLYKYGYARFPENKIAEKTGVSGEGWIEWDITDDYKKTVNNGDAELVLTVCNTYIVKSPNGTNANAYVRFHSKENASGNKPKLEISFTPSGIQQHDGEFVSYYTENRILFIENTSTSSINLVIMDISGKTIHSACFNRNFEYALSETGIYILQMNDSEKTIARKVIIK